MSPVLIAYIAGMASAFGISTAFVLFCMWHAKRYPLVPSETEEVLAAETTIYCPPSYGFSLNPRGKHQ